MVTRQRNNQMDNDSIARKVKQLRTDRGLTLEKLGQMAGCTKAYISQVEKGLSTPSVAMLGRIAEALNVSVTELFRIDNNNQVRTWRLPKSERRKIHYPDGTIKVRTSSGVTIIYPDGHKNTFTFVDALVPIPPSLPDEMENNWLEDHSKRLLDIIGSLVPKNCNSF